MNTQTTTYKPFFVGYKPQFYFHELQICNSKKQLPYWMKSNDLYGRCRICGEKMGTAMHQH